MFEEGYWDAVDPATGDPMSCYHEPELTEAEHLAAVERLIAADPANRAEPTAAEVILRGQTEALTPGLVQALEAIDPSSLDEDDAVGYAVAADRVLNRWAALRGLAVARATAMAPDCAQVPRELHATAQLGAALGLGRGAADTLVTASTELTDRLPAARQLALAGNLTWRKASSLATATLALTDTQAGQVEATVLPRSWQQPTGKFDAAVRKAVDLVDPDGVDTRAKQRREDIRMVRHHYGNGMAQVFLDMPAEHADRLWLAADTWARRRTNDGDPRPLDELRVGCWVAWADSFLTHADPLVCDRDNHHTPTPTTDTDTDKPAAVQPVDQPAEAAPVPVQSGPSVPRRHGRSVVQTIVWDLTSLLGLTRHGGLILDADTVIGPAAVRDLIAAGVRVRRGTIDRFGHLIDLTPKAWYLPPTDGSTHRAPVELLVTTTTSPGRLPLNVQWTLQDLDGADPTLAAVLRDLLDHPLTADTLDAHPDDEQASAHLAAFICLRAGHPINPTAGPSPATAADLDHHLARAAGGKTHRDNLGPLTRRWHRLKTFDGWTVKQTPQGWHWTSPTGRKYLIEPFDYRLGP
jgi:hypothetical protein